MWDASGKLKDIFSLLKDGTKLITTWIIIDQLKWTQLNCKSKVIRLEKFDFEKWEYDLVKVRGNFVDEFFIVEKAKGVRNGHIILKPLLIDKDRTILVNLGWVPETEFENIEKYQQKFSSTS